MTGALYRDPIVSRAKFGVIVGSEAARPFNLGDVTITSARRQTGRMWTFLAALAGGLIALLGSGGTTYYMQRQAIKAERRARVTQAADEILAAVTALRELPRELEKGSPSSLEAERWTEWHDKKESLINRIMVQGILMRRAQLSGAHRFRCGRSALLCSALPTLRLLRVSAK